MANSHDKKLLQWALHSYLKEIAFGSWVLCKGSFLSPIEGRGIFKLSIHSIIHSMPWSGDSRPHSLCLLCGCFKCFHALSQSILTIRGRSLVPFYSQENRDAAKFIIPYEAIQPGSSELVQRERI